MHQGSTGAAGVTISTICLDSEGSSFLASKDEILEILQSAKQLLLEEQEKKTTMFPPFQKKTSPSRRPLFIPSTCLPKKEIEKPEPQRKEETSNKQNAEVISGRAPKSTICTMKLEQLIGRACPHLKLVKSIPDDRIAIQRKNAWKYRNIDVEILILSMNNNDRQKTLLSNMANAISALGKKVQVVDTDIQEKENSWDPFLALSNLSFVIAPPLAHWKTPLLQTHLTLHPATKEAHIGRAKVLFLPPVEDLLSDLQMKLKVWKWLVSTLQV